jgi:YggT family protein
MQSGTALLYLMNTGFDILVFICIFRFFAQLLSMNFYNPIIRYTVKITGWAIRPLSFFIPTVGRCNLAIFLLAFLLEIFKIAMNFGLFAGNMPSSVSGVFLWAFAEILAGIVQLFTWAIFGEVILSWIKPAGVHPLIEIIYSLSTVLMRPVRKLIPPLGGLDLTPIPVLIGLKFFSMLLIAPMLTLGMRLSGI